LLTLRGHSSRLSSLAFPPDGNLILTGASDGTARLWDREGRELQLFDQHPAKVNVVAFAPDGQSIMIGYEDHQIKEWSLDGELRLSLVGHTGQVADLAFSPDGRYLLSCGWDETARIWDRRGYELWTLPISTSKVAYAPDGQHLLTIVDENKAARWMNIPRLLAATTEVFSLEALKDLGLAYAEQDVQEIRAW
ncbi:MAG: hypothetical protein KDC54_04245, partial [Lewinella sp.]|nr:hypothetical protein [Lewinella sp.]